MKITRGIRIGLAMLAGFGFCCLSAGADVYVPGAHARSQVPTIKSPDDAISSIPILGKLSRAFLVGDGFKFQLSAKELRIDHMGSDSRSPVSQRNCMISLNFVSPVAFFGSSMEIPLLNAASPSTHWVTSSLGDYVMHLSKDAAVDHPTLGLKVSARF